MLTQQELMHEVLLLYPGRYTWGNVQIRKDHSYHGVQVYEIINPLPVPLLGGISKPKEYMKMRDQPEYLRFLQQIKPDVIHFHTLMGIHKDLLTAAHRLNIRTLFTSHDYFGICPKVNLIDLKGAHCSDYADGRKCVDCNAGAYSGLTIYIIQSKLYRLMKDSKLVKRIRMHTKKMYRAKMDAAGRFASEKPNPFYYYAKLRTHYLEMLKSIDFFHFNSELAQSIYLQYLDVQGKVIPIMHRDIKDQRKLKAPRREGSPIILAYIGPIEHYKGFYLLLESLAYLKSITSAGWRLHIYGSGSAEEYEEISEQVTFFGTYRYDELETIFENIDLLIIPSISMETFGLVGIEALSYGVPLLVSNHAGIRDLVRDGVNGIIFEPNVRDLAANLLLILENNELLSGLNKNIVESEFTYSMDGHAREIIQQYDHLLSLEVQNCD